MPPPRWGNPQRLGWKEDQPGLCSDLNLIREHVVVVRHGEGANGVKKHPFLSVYA
jgi:hypothetical protein